MEAVVENGKLRINKVSGELKKQIEAELKRVLKETKMYSGTEILRVIKKEFPGVSDSDIFDTLRTMDLFNNLSNAGKEKREFYFQLAGDDGEGGGPYSSLNEAKQKARAAANVADIPISEFEVEEWITSADGKMSIKKHKI